MLGRARQGGADHHPLSRRGRQRGRRGGGDVPWRDRGERRRGGYLSDSATPLPQGPAARRAALLHEAGRTSGSDPRDQAAGRQLFLRQSHRARHLRRWPVAEGGARQKDRTSVVQGKRVSVRVDLGGRRIIKKKKK